VRAGLGVVDGQPGEFAGRRGGPLEAERRADGQRRMRGAEESGARAVEGEVRRDADVGRNVDLRVTEMPGERGADRRVPDRAAGQVAGVHQVRAPLVVALPGAEPAEDGDPVHLPGDQGEVLADPHAGDAGGDLLEGAAVGMAGFEVEGVDLAGAAAHPEEDAVPAVRGRRPGDGLHPAPGSNSDGRQSKCPDDIAAGELEHRWPFPAAGVRPAVAAVNG
jgi:hypothetical protein